MADGEYAGRVGRGARSTGDASSSMPTPGKLTRSSALEPDGVHTAARQGVEGSGGTLPYLDQIQRSFGRHDVSGVRAHVGGAAETAAKSIGAAGYATGNDVALRGGASLQMVAHEAAHVVQQRGGVQLASGVGAAGDAYERNADAVADRVVRGESAEDLLTPYAGSADSSSASASPQAAVQRFTEVSDSDLPWDKISDNGQIAVLDHERDAWAEGDVIARSNAILDQNKSRARIEPESGFTKVKAAGRDHYLQKFKMVDRGAGWWKSTFGDPEVDLTDDCGSANQQMMGAEHARQRAFVAASKHGTAQELTGTSSYHGDDNRPGGSVSTTETLSGEIYVRIMDREFNKTVDRATALKDWAALTDVQREALSKKYGINKHAAPTVGQGVTIGSERDMPGATGGGYNFHFALNLMSAGHDYLSLEDFDESGVKYYFKMYGPASQGQSFAEDPDNAGAVANKSTAMVVVHPHMLDGRIKTRVRLRSSVPRGAAVALDKDTKVKILQKSPTELEIEVLSGGHAGQRGWIPGRAYADD